MVPKPIHHREDAPVYDLTIEKDGIPKHPTFHEMLWRHKEGKTIFEDYAYLFEGNFLKGTPTISLSSFVYDHITSSKITQLKVTNVQR